MQVAFENRVCPMPIAHAAILAHGLLHAEAVAWKARALTLPKGDSNRIYLRRVLPMSLKLRPNESVPVSTAQIAHAAFPKGNPYLTLRNALGTIFHDADFADLHPTRGQPASCPWRLALVTIFQFRENLSDRQAAEASALALTGNT